MKAVVFVTLLLGLVHGPQTVEVEVGEGVAVVEILVDGSPVRSIDGPPWRAAVDLGEELAPHRLEVVAFDDAGGELERLHHDVNSLDRQRVAWLEGRHLPQEVEVSPAPLGRRQR